MSGVLQASSALPLDKKLVVSTSLASFFLVMLSEQLIATNIVDVQGGLAATPDEASWILTVYSMGNFSGIVAAIPFIRAVGLGRCLTACSLMFTVTALCCVIPQDLSTVIALRALEGIAAGVYGPAAFFSVFANAGGPRLPAMMTILAFLLVAPASIGPVLSGFVEEAFGWRALFISQAALGCVLAFASHGFIPRAAFDWSALKVDWFGIVFLAATLALFTLILTQGTRRFWFESDMILWSACAFIGVLAGYLVISRLSSAPILSLAVILRHPFSVTNSLNLLFRAATVVTSYLVPQFLVIMQGFRPLDVSRLMVWAAVPQLFAWPAVWWAMQHMQARWIAAFGLLLCGSGTALVMNASSTAAAGEFHACLALFGVGQILFLVPALVVGTTALRPPDLPTASLAFNIATVGGTLIGSGAISHVVIEREKFHSNVLTEAISSYDWIDRDFIARLAAHLGGVIIDDGRSTAASVAFLATSSRRAAFAFAFNDAFGAITALLLIAALGAIAIGRHDVLADQASSFRGDLP